MAVKLRLKRMGSKQRPFYRVVAADSKSPRDGKFIEIIGIYNPITEPAELKIDEELALKWLKNGAVPTDTVRSLFKQAGINQKFHNEKMSTKKNAEPKKKAPVKKTEVKTTTKKAEPKKTTTKKTTKEEK